MVIANPIYDTVFKYLMEDLDIAKGVLSIILNTEIVELNVKSQETTSEFFATNKIPINIYRLDFVAVIKQADGTFKKALIELQKTKRSTNISRFRKYLGENYQKEDNIIEDGVEVNRPLEIITIYFLGFELEDVPVSVLKVKNCFVDATTGKILENEPRSQFIRLLNHESYTIQIPKLQPNEKSRLEKVLNVFSQKYKTNDIHILNYQGQMDDPLIEKILNRLIRAISDDNLRRQMNVEDEIETEWQEMSQKIAEKDKKLKEKDDKIEETNKQNKEMNKQNKELLREIEKLKKQIKK